MNVLEDPENRVRLSEHSNWTNIPPLFVNGALIGGCDIVMEMEVMENWGSAADSRDLVISDKLHDW